VLLNTFNTVSWAIWIQLSWSADPIKLSAVRKWIRCKQWNNGGVVQGFDGDDLLFSGDGDGTLSVGAGDDPFYRLSGRDAYVGWLGNGTLDRHQHDAAVKTWSSPAEVVHP
jgi:Ca2+-binding RTX toxin-like protein